MKRYIRSAVQPGDGMDYMFAKRASTSPEQLAQIANSKNWITREEVANNPNTPIPVLAMLADDNSEHGAFVRNCVARNLNTPVDILRKLSDDPSGTVRASVAGNPNTPVDILVKLSTDVDPIDAYIVRFQVAENKNTPVETLREMTHDSSKYVQLAALRTLTNLRYG